MSLCVLLAGTALYPEYAATTGHPTAPDARLQHLHRWSLLLHYTCVRNPTDTDMRVKCSRLSRRSQERIARFFTVLVSQPSVDRPLLQAAIDAAVIADGRPGDDATDSEPTTPEHGANSSAERHRQPNDDDNDRSGDGASSDAELGDVASPLRLNSRLAAGGSRPTMLRQMHLLAASSSPLHGVRTPSRSGAPTATTSTSATAAADVSSASNRSGASHLSGVGLLSGGGGKAANNHSGDAAAASSSVSLSALSSPAPAQSSSAVRASTPRTRMLDEWSWENRQLKARIEAEQDERVFLEAQLRQAEAKIEALGE